MNKSQEEFLDSLESLLRAGAQAGFIFATEKTSPNPIEMPVEEFDKMLDDIVEVLEANKRAASPDLINTLEQANNKLKENPALFALLCTMTGKDVNTLLSYTGNVEEFIRGERILTAEGFTEKLVGGLKTLKARPLIKRAVALFF